MTEFLLTLTSQADEVLPGGWFGEFLRATAWPMEKPKPYGWFHLGFVFVFGALSVILLIITGILSMIVFKVSATNENK